MNIVISTYIKNISNCLHLPLKTNRVFLKTIKHTLFISFLMYAASWQATYAQVKPPTSANIYEPKPLSIGDTIPEKRWNTPLQVLNDKQGRMTFTLADYTGALFN